MSAHSPRSPLRLFVTSGTLGLALAISGCSSPEPLARLVDRTNADVGSRLGVSSDLGRFLTEPLPDRRETCARESSRRADNASSAPVLTLRDAQAAALTQNLSLSAAAENLPIAQLALVQAGLLTNPVIGQSNGLLFPVAPVLGGPASFDVNISQQLNSIFTRDARIGVAQVQRFQAGVDLAAQAFELGMKVEEKYRQIAHADASLAILRRVSETYARAEQAAVARSRVGVVPVPEVNRARIAALDAARQVERAELQRRQALRDLNFLIGAPLETLWKISPETLGPEAPIPDESRLRELANRYRLDLAHAALDERAAEENVRLAEAGLIPAISAGVEGVFTGGNGGSGALGPFVSIELPIFDSHRTALEAQQVSLRKLRKTTAALAGQAEADAVSAGHALELAIGDLAFQRDRAVPQQRETARLAEVAFQLGQIDLDSLLNTLRDVTTAELASQDALTGYDAAVVGLERAIGISLSAASVAPLDAQPVTPPAVTPPSPEINR